MANPSSLCGDVGGGGGVGGGGAEEEEPRRRSRGGGAEEEEEEEEEVWWWWWRWSASHGLTGRSTFLGLREALRGGLHDISKLYSVGIVKLLLSHQSNSLTPHIPTPRVSL